MSESESALFLRKVDLASRRLGAGVVAASDELFAERENLIVPAAPVHQPHTFGHKGQVYDGWETRRRRDPAHHGRTADPHRGDAADWAIVRLGVAGVVAGVVVDTAFFTGNFPSEVSLEGTAVEGYRSPDELLAGDWLPLVKRSAVVGDTRNLFQVECDRRVTHVKLSIYPDGGVARLRVHGDVVADPRFLSRGSVDLAALANGASVTRCSNLFYSSPVNLISPGEANVMSDGWETSRRRDDGNDWVEVALAGPGTVRLAELDTRHFVGNAPGGARLTGVDARRRDPDNPDAWVELLPRERLQPDTPHRFLLTGEAEVTHVRMDIYPDGGMARLRLWGDLSDEGRASLTRRWADSLPQHHRDQITSESSVSELAASPSAPYSEADMS